MRNAELRMQNCGISHGNDFKYRRSRHNHSPFCILHLSFYIALHRQRDKLEFDFILPQFLHNGNRFHGVWKKVLDKRTNV